MELKARDLDREFQLDPEGDRFIPSSELVQGNAADDQEMIAVSKCAVSLLLQKEFVRIDLEPFEQEMQPLAKIWRVKMEDDAINLGSSVVILG